MGQLTSSADETLLQSALGGDEAAWYELIDRYNGKGLAYIRRQIDDPYLAQDILQNLWATLVQSVRRQAPDHFGALFWTMLKRRLIDELRRKGRTREAATLDAPLHGEESDRGTLLDQQRDGTPDPLEATVHSEQEQIIQRALEQLPDHYRIVIVARQLDGLSNRETAALLVSEGLVTDDGNVEKRVENYYYRGLKELKKQLIALGFFGGGSAA